MFLVIRYPSNFSHPSHFHHSGKIFEDCFCVKHSLVILSAMKKSNAQFNFNQFIELGLGPMIDQLPISFTEVLG